MTGVDEKGRWHVSRAIPLTWLLSFSALCVSGIAGAIMTARDVVTNQSETQLQIKEQTVSIDKVHDEIRAVSSSVRSLSDSVIRESGRIDALRDRVNGLEGDLRLIYRRNGAAAATN